MNISRGINVGSEDVVYEQTYQDYHARLCFPGLQAGFPAFLKNFGNFYQCNFTPASFLEQKSTFKHQAAKLFRDNANNQCEYIAHLHRKIQLVEIGLNENWHSPVFVIKNKGKIFCTTGHNKIYATAIRKKQQHLDFKCFVLDIDRDPEHHFENIIPVDSNDDFSSMIGSSDFGIELSFELIESDFLPCVMQFSLTYPIRHHKGENYKAIENRHFIQPLFKNNRIVVNVYDEYDSSITSENDFFDIFIIKTNTKISRPDDIRNLNFSNNQLHFQTFKKIKFDLDELLPFFTEKNSIYTAQDRSFVAWVETSSAMHSEKIVCPSYTVVS